MKPRPAPTRDAIYEELEGQPQTVAMLAMATGKSRKQVQAAIYGSPRLFKKTGKKNGTAVIWTVKPVVTKNQKFAQILGHAQQKRLENEALDAQRKIAAERPPLDEEGRFEVQYVNAYGYTIHEPVYSRNYADMLAAERGGEVVRV